MKKSGLYLGLLSLLLLMACKEKEVVQSETVETTKTVSDHTSDTVVVKTEEKAPDGTAVKVNSNGISVDSKDVNVEVKK